MYLLLTVGAAVAIGFVGATAGLIPALALAAMLLPALVAVAGAHLFVVGAARILSELRGADGASRPVTPAARRCA
jgi:hypothetical protein